MTLVCLEESNIVRGEHLQHVIEDKQAKSCRPGFSRVLLLSTTYKQSYSLPLVEKVKTFARNAFLPEGFPDSVSEDYLNYQIWDTVQAFASSISGSLATQAVLEGVFTSFFPFLIFIGICFDFTSFFLLLLFSYRHWSR